MAKALLAGFLLFASVLSVFFPVFAAEAPTQREWDIYYAIVEQVNSLDKNDEAGRASARSKVAATYGVTEEGLSAVEDKVLDYGLREEEKPIFNEWLERTKSSDPKSTTQDQLALMAQIERKYGISHSRLSDIVARVLSDAYMEGDY